MLENICNELLRIFFHHQLRIVSKLPHGNLARSQRFPPASIDNTLAFALYINQIGGDHFVWLVVAERDLRCEIQVNHISQVDSSKRSSGSTACLSLGQYEFDSFRFFYVVQFLSRADRHTIGVEYQTEERQELRILCVAIP